MPKFRGNAKLTFTLDVEGIEVDAADEDAAADMIEEAADSLDVDPRELHLQDTDVEDAELVEDEEDDDGDLEV